MLAAKALSASRSSPVVAPVLFAGASALVVALHLATNGTLGFHTDELYYLDSGRHPAFGYVDFPPIVPLLARLDTSILGVTPWALRVLPTLLGGVMVALSGAYVRKLGGSLRMQALALLIAVTAPYFLGSNWVYQTVTFDECTWMVSLYWFLCVVVDGRARHWIYLGLSLGIGLEVKFTILALVAAIGLAVLVTPSLRATLRTRHPWIAAAIALAIWAPNVAWQVTEDFPTLTYVANHSGAGGGVLDNALLILVYLFFLLPLWIAGLVSLVRSPRLRPISIACVLPLVLYLFVGKSYYAVGTVPIAIAQGVIAVSRVPRPRLRTGLEVAIVVASLLQLLVFAQLTLPITPPNRIHALGLDAQNELFADSVGWDDIARQVTAAYEGLPASERQDTAIISAYYGVPGALQVYGGPKEHPVVVSPQLSDWYWLPKHVDATNALMVDYGPKDVAWMCDSPSLLTRLVVPYAVKGLEQGAPVTFCPLRISIADAWPRLKNFS
ncbi:MAG TPA: glycosyltransferase family 39 protein [Candidatus Dormibacteraeota bacterium]|nr:glycosyltransferase family 39 protein [Candidatus Dormibacteraeota bacterium]